MKSNLNIEDKEPIEDKQNLFLFFIDIGERKGVLMIVASTAKIVINRKY